MLDYGHCIGCTKSGIELSGGPKNTIAINRTPEYRRGSVPEIADGGYSEDTETSYTIT